MLRPLLPSLKAAPGPKHFLSKAQRAYLLASAKTWNTYPTIQGHPPEVIVIGRANVGKSTLLNTIMHRSSLAPVSKQAGRTRALDFYGVGPKPPKLVFVDAPGYGERGLPSAGVLFQHYLRHREELKRVYILISANHGVTESDKAMLGILNKSCERSMKTNHPWTLQAVFTKADTVRRQDAPQFIQGMRQDLFTAAPLCLPPIITSVSNIAPVGIQDLQRSVVEACGLGNIQSKVIRASS